MYSGYLTLGGIQILNNHRVRDYTESAGIGGVYACTSCSSITAGRGEHYKTPAIDVPHPQWWQDAYPIGSADFFGVMGISIDEVDDSTRRLQVSDAPGSGGYIGPLRYDVRSLTIRAVAVAADDCALGYGLTWLRSLDSKYTCSTSTVVMYECCPHISTEDCEDDACRVSCLAKVRREMYEARITSGPTVLMRRDLTTRGSIAQIEMVITAGDPFFYAPPFPLPVGTVPEEFAHTDIEIDEPPPVDPFASPATIVTPPSLSPVRSLPPRAEWTREVYPVPTQGWGYSIAPTLTLASLGDMEDLRVTLVGPDGVAGAYRMVGFPAGGSVELDFRSRTVTTEANGIRRSGSTFVRNPLGGPMRWPKDLPWGEYHLLVDRVPGSEPPLVDLSVAARLSA